MGNTKYIWFEGHFNKDRFNELTRESLFEKSHASYVVIEKDDHGYLGNDKELPYALGIIHSYSTIGLRAIDFIAGLMKSGFIGYLDQDMPEHALYYVRDGKKEKEVFNDCPD